MYEQLISETEQFLNSSPDPAAPRPTAAYFEYSDATLAGVCQNCEHQFAAHVHLRYGSDCACCPATICPAFVPRSRLRERLQTVIRWLVP